MTVIPMPTPAQRAENRYTAPRRRKTGPSTLGTMDDAAACTLRPGLPWVADTTPSGFHQSQMRAVCSECPIRRQCADHATRTMPMGFYAGVWIPGMGGGRAAALKMLRRVAGGQS